MIFSQMLDIIALNDSALVLCTKKFSFVPQGGLYPENAPFSYNGLKMALLSLYFQNNLSDFDDFVQML